MDFNQPEVIAYILFVFFGGFIAGRIYERIKEANRAKK